LAAAGASGCKGGRIAQCNTLIQVINEEQAKQKETRGSDPEELNSLADSLEQTATRIAAVELSDEQLIAFRDEYKKMAEDMAKAARDARDASSDPVKLEAASKAMQEIGPRETKLVSSINEYCGGG